VGDQPWLVERLFQNPLGDMENHMGFETVSWDFQKLGTDLGFQWNLASFAMDGYHV